MPNFFARPLKSAGGFNPTDNTTISNSSSFTPSSGVEYLMVTFLLSGILFSYRYIASYESNPGKFLRSLVVSLEILPIGTNIVMEYRTLGLCVMIFCQNHLFLGIGAAYGRTIAVTARDEPVWNRRIESRLFYGDAFYRKCAVSHLGMARWSLTAVHSQDWLPRLQTLRSDIPPLI